MKKMICLVLSTLLLISILTSILVSATAGVSIAASVNGSMYKIVGAGDSKTVTITYYLTTPNLICDGVFSISYDNSMLSLKNVELPVLKNGNPIMSSINDNPYNVSFVGMDNNTNSGIYNFKKSGQLVKAEFEINNNASDMIVIDLTINELNALENNVYTTYYSNGVQNNSFDIESSMKNPYIAFDNSTTPPVETTTENLTESTIQTNESTETTVATEFSENPTQSETQAPSSSTDNSSTEPVLPPGFSEPPTEPEIIEEPTSTSEVSRPTSGTYGRYNYKVLDDGTVSIRAAKKGVVDSIIPSTVDGYKVTVLEDNAFSHSDFLTSVTVPDGIRYIGINAFAYCEHLNNITILSRDAVIGEKAFGYVENVQNVPSGWYVYYDGGVTWHDSDSGSVLGTTQLGKNTNLVIHGYYNSTAQEYAFANDFSFNAIDGCSYSYISDDTLYIKNDNKIETLQNNTNIYPWKKDVKTIIIEDGVSIIPDYAFRGLTELKKVILPSSVNTIGKGAFSGCANLKQIELPEGITKIEKKTFYNSGLEKITIPDSVSEIGEYAFSECSELSEIKLGDNISSIGRSAFSICKKLEAINLPKNLTSIEDNTFYYSGLRSLTIPENVTIIKDHAFDQCDNLTNITLPDSLLKIGKFVFDSPVKEIVLPESILEISATSFYSVLWKFNNSTRRLCYKGTYEQWYNVKIQDSDYQSDFIKSLGVVCNNGEVPVIYGSTGGLYNCNFDNKSIVITSYKGSAEHPVIPSVIKFDTNEYTVKSIGKSAFNGCKTVKTITLPEGVKYINESAFNDCYNLKEIVGLENVVSIGDHAFANCHQLKNLLLSEKLYYINYSTFYNCFDLTSVALPAHIYEIKANAFCGCYKLSEISIDNNVKTIGDSAFLDCYELKTVAIPKSVANIGERAFGYKFGGEKIDDFTIKGFNSTAAAYYAKNNGFRFESFIKDIEECSIKGIGNKTYNGKTQNQFIIITDGSTQLKYDIDYTVSYKNNKNAGTAYVYISGIGNYEGSLIKHFEIRKASNPVKVTAKATVKANAKKKTTIKKVITVKNPKGKVTYTTNNKKVTVKNGTMTVAKGLKKGKTYKIKVTITVKGNGNYKSKKIVKYVKVKVK